MSESWVDAVSVAGTYCGNDFSGVLVTVRQHTLNSRVWIGRVQLDEPFTFNGRVRTEVEMWADFHGNGTSGASPTGDSVRPL